MYAASESYPMCIAIALINSSTINRFSTSATYNVYKNNPADTPQVSSIIDSLMIYKGKVPAHPLLKSCYLEHKELERQNTGQTFLHRSFSLLNTYFQYLYPFDESL